MQNQLNKMSLYLVYLAGILMSIVIATTVINVTSFGLDKIMRLYGMNVGGLPGYEESVRLFISCIALMFFPWAQIQKSHVSVDFFADKFSEKTQKTLVTFWLCVTFVLALFLIYMMILGAMASYADGATSNVLEWVEWIFYIPGIISLCLWAVILAFQILHKEPAHG